MALTICSGSSGATGIGILGNTSTKPLKSLFPPRRNAIFPFSTTRTLHITSAKKFSSRSGRVDGKNRRSNLTTKEQEEDQFQRSDEIQGSSKPENGAIGVNFEISADGTPFPELPGLQPDFWEGPQWDALGFFVEYLWAFAILFSLVACGVAVVTYNEGATDFKETPVYKEAVQSRELLEGPEASGADVFESNPTEVAPSVE